MTAAALILVLWPLSLALCWQFARLGHEACAQRRAARLGTSDPVSIGTVWRSIPDE